MVLVDGYKQVFINKQVKIIKHRCWLRVGKDAGAQTVGCQEPGGCRGPLKGPEAGTCGERRGSPIFLRYGTRRDLGDVGEGETTRRPSPRGASPGPSLHLR